jgi:hypothetical protein
MARALKLTLATLLGLAIIAFTAWGCLALWHRAGNPVPFIGALMCLSALALLLVWRAAPDISPAWPGLAALAAAFAALCIWWGTIQPRGDRAWAAPLARTPSVSIDGDRFTISNVRNFRWRAASVPQADSSGEEIAEERWETRSHDLSKVAGVDLFFSYWTGPLVAHLLTSITFDDGPPLTFSIEIRREAGEVYSALAGFFKSYELAIVAADERDIIRLRTDIWREDVRLYRLNVSREKARALLLAYAAEIGALHARPRWYDTLGANCSTVAFRLARQLWPGLGFDWRILFPGRAPDYAYEIGAVRTDLALDELKRRAAISEIARALPADADFSEAIRRGVPEP